MFWKRLFSHYAEERKYNNVMRCKSISRYATEKKSIESTTHLLSLFPSNPHIVHFFFGNSMFRRRHCGGKKEWSANLIPLHRLSFPHISVSIQFSGCRSNGEYWLMVYGNLVKRNLTYTKMLLLYRAKKGSNQRRWLGK